MNIPNICVAVDNNALKRKNITVAYFNCVKTDKKLATNKSAFPFSPFGGGDLVLANNKTAVLSTADIKRDLANIGTCPVCEAKQYTLKATAVKLIGCKNEELNCTLCQSPYKINVKAAEALIDAVQKENDDNISNDELPTDLVEATEPECLIQASDDDDMEDDDDDDMEDEDNSDDDSDEDEPESEDDEDEDEDMADDDDMEDEPESDEDEDEDEDEDDDDLGEFEDENDEPDEEDTEEEEDEPETYEDEDEEDEPDTENENTDDKTVEASALNKSLEVSMLTASGGLDGKNLTLVPVNNQLALVLANDIPVIKLEASKAGKNKTLFDDPDKLGRAFNEILSSDKENLDLTGLGGSAITVSVPVADEIHQNIETGIKAVTASLNAKEDAVAKDFRQCLSIAALMIQRNLDKDVVNPLFDATVAQLKKHGVRGDAVIASANNIFAQAGEEFIKLILAKATELRGKPLAARNEIAKLAEQAPYQLVTASISEDVANKLGDTVIPFTPRNNEVLVASAEPPNMDNVAKFRSLLK